MRRLVSFQFGGAEGRVYLAILPLSSRSAATSSWTCGCAQSASAVAAAMGGSGLRGSPP